MSLEDLKARVSNFPTSPGVYLMRNDKDKVVYVGKAKSLKARVRSYLGSLTDQSIKTRYLMSHVVKIDYMLTKTEVEAFLLEASLIKKHRPRYNIRLKDDKAYPYIRCSLEHPFPRFYLARRVAADGGVYFGPFTSAFSVRETIRFLNRTFKVRDCSDSFFKTRTRPCISYQIGHCTAPCVKLVEEATYRDEVDNALKFLKGRSTKVLSSLTHKMKSAAEGEHFEQAAKLRDSIQAIERIWDRQTVVTTKKDYDVDVVAFFGDARGTLIESVFVRGGRVTGSRPHFIAKFDCTSESEEVKDWLTSFLNQYYSDNMVPDEILLPVDLGNDMIKLVQAVFLERQGKKCKITVATGSEGKKLLDLALTNAKGHFQDAVTKADRQAKGLEQIQQKFGLKHLPRRIECYDISNFQGSQSVASQVVFEDGGPSKDHYRRYKIKTVTGADDFASMKEVLTRRFQHTEYDDPDLIVVDGGKGQLNMAVAALKEIGRSELALVGMAKARTLGDFSDADVSSSEERFFLPGRQNPVLFPANSEAMQILVGIRDEAHRFAITYHRKLRDESSLSSVLDSVVGLGEKRKTALLKAFKSIDDLKSASVEALIKVPGMNRVVAERMLIHLQSMAEEE